MSELNLMVEKWACAAAPTHEPDQPEGTEDGFATCRGCGNDLWVGYETDR